MQVNSSACSNFSFRVAVHVMFMAGTTLGIKLRFRALSRVDITGLSISAPVCIIRLWAWVFVRRTVNRAAFLTGGVPILIGDRKTPFTHCAFSRWVNGAADHLVRAATRRARTRAVVRADHGNAHIRGWAAISIGQATALDFGGHVAVDGAGGFSVAEICVIVHMAVLAHWAACLVSATVTEDLIGARAS